MFGPPYYSGPPDDMPDEDTYIEMVREGACEYWGDPAVPLSPEDEEVVAQDDDPFGPTNTELKDIVCP